MSVIAIRAALETQLAAMSPPLPTAWENSAFDPEVDAPDVPYQKVNLLFAEPDNAEIGPQHVERGIFQVTLFYPAPPVSEGPGDASARAELIRQAFPRGSSLVSGGVVVTIQKTPEIAPALPDGDRFALAVRIRFTAPVNS